MTSEMTVTMDALITEQIELCKMEDGAFYLGVDSYVEEALIAHLRETTTGGDYEQRARALIARYISDRPWAHGPDQEPRFDEHCLLSLGYGRYIWMGEARRDHLAQHMQVAEQIHQLRLILHANYVLNLRLIAAVTGEHPLAGGSSEGMRVLVEQTDHWIAADPERAARRMLELSAVA